MNRLFIRIWVATLAVVILATVLSHLGFVLATRAQNEIQSEEYLNSLIETEEKIIFKAKSYGIEEAISYIQTLDDSIQRQLVIYNDKNFDITTTALNIQRPIWITSFPSPKSLKKNHEVAFYDRWGEHFIMKINENVELPIWFSSSWTGYILRFSISLFFSGLAAFLLARHVCNPILMTAHKLRAITNGDLNTRIPTIITKRKDEVGQLARSLNRMIEAILIMRNNEQRILSDIAHDIRSPLSRQKLALSFLEKKGIQASSTKFNEYLERAQIENGRLSELINDLLIYFRSAHPQPQAFERISLSQIITEVVEDASFEFSTLNKFIECDLKEDIVILGIYSKLIRAIENVVRNAMFHTNNGTTVQVKVHTNAQKIIIDIIDQGTGVEESQIPYLTQPFFRTDSARSQEKGGYGLGLPICQSIITQHGGTLEFSNEPNFGLKVRITLPKIDN